MKTTVVNCRLDKYDVYIGRGSSGWGNPFVFGPSASPDAKYRARSREDAIVKYEKWLREQPELLARVREELVGKSLGCFCKPNFACHGDVLARIANEDSPEDVEAMRKPGGYDPEEHGADCRNCPSRKNAVVPPTTVSSDRLRLVIVGEGPGRTEEKWAKPFVGPSGKLLDSIFDEVGFDRDTAHITNATLCRPDNEMAETQSTICCAPRLSRELSALPSSVPILTLGASASKIVLGVGAIQQNRGFVWRAPTIDPKKMASIVRTIEKTSERIADEEARCKREKLRKRSFRLLKLIEKREKATVSLKALEARAPLAGRVVLPSVHPSFILQGADLWRSILRIDVDRAARIAANGIASAENPDGVVLQDEQPYTVAATARELRIALAKMRKMIAVDIETDGIDPLRCSIVSINISDVTPDGKGTTVVAYPWRAEMAPVLKAAVSRRVVGTHNGPAFDEISLERNGVTYDQKEDTLIAHHAFASHFPQRLAHVATEFTDVGPWKQKHKGRGSIEERGMSPWEAGGEELTRYGAADGRVQSIIWHRMQADLEPEIEIYRHDMALAAICRRMQIAGIRVDEARRDQLATLLRRRSGGLLGQMRSMVGSRSFNPNKPDDVRAALFGHFRAPVLKLTAKGLKSTAAETLENLKERGTRAGDFADCIIRYREARKTRSTFLNPEMIGSDGRVHPSWRCFGTISGRWGCRGPNLMNLPHAQGENREIDVRSIYIPRPGCVFVYFDVGQAEMRFAAYLSGDMKFIDEIESGDPYLARAKVIYPDGIELFNADPKTLSKEALGVRKDLRQIAKKASLAANYYADAPGLFAKLHSEGVTMRVDGEERSITLDQVSAVLDVIHESYRTYYRFVDANLEACRRDGFMRSAVLGRVFWMGWYPKITDVANRPIQSGIADLMNLRLLEIEKLKPEGAQLVAQVHDACIFEVPIPQVDTMKAVLTDVWSKPVTLRSNGTSFTLPIELKVGESWGDFG